jgi:ribonuclease P protein component
VRGDANGSCPNKLAKDRAGRSHRKCGRLRRDAEFERVRAEGGSWSSPLMVLRAAPAPEGIRFGTIASKRLGKAVRRNRVRRLVREAIRRVCDRLRPGWDLVIVARSQMVAASADQVQSALEELASRAGLIVGPPEDQTSAGGFLL